MIWRDIKVRYKQTALGAAWAILQPVLTMLVFTFLFGNIARMETDGGIPYPIFSYTALLPWGLFSTALNSASRSLTSNQNMITKTYFPRLVLPMASVLGGLLDFAIAFVVLIGMMVYYGITPGLHALWAVPVFLLLALITALGVAWGSPPRTSRIVTWAMPCPSFRNSGCSSPQLRTPRRSSPSSGRSFTPSTRWPAWSTVFAGRCSAWAARPTC
jgi:lipopolysaccharide transport system permease protein